MIFARLRFAIALIAFVAWLGWLAVAVAQKGDAVLSRAQLLNATHLVYAEVSVGDDGLPKSNATVVEVARGDAVSGTITVLNLSKALPSGAKSFPGPGLYLLPLGGDGKTFRVVGLPRSPGYDAADPVRPVIYPATDATRLQLQRLLEPQP